MAAVCLGVASATLMRAEDLTGQVKKAVEKSTLDQQGTKPFHLKASYAPSLERDKDSHRTGRTGDMVGVTNTLASGGAVSGVPSN